MAGESDLLSELLTNPLAWVLLIAFIIFILYTTFHKDQGQFTDPNLGKKVVKKTIKDSMDARDKLFSMKPKKAYLYRDVFKLGKIKTIEEIPKNKKIGGGKGEAIDRITLISLSIKPCGFWHEVLDIFGVGSQRIIVDDKHIKSVFDDRKKEIHYMINKNIFFRQMGDVFVLSGHAEKEFIDEIVLANDLEEMKGRLSTLPHAWANTEKGHSEMADLLEVKAMLDERKEQRKRVGYAGS